MDGIYEVIKSGDGWQAQVTQGPITKFAWGRTRGEAISNFLSAAEWSITTGGRTIFARSRENLELRLRLLGQNPRNMGFPL